MPPELLHMQGIGKAFSGRHVLENVDFDLAPGEIHALAGENGAGKSTLVRIISGVYTDYEGDLILDGRPVRFSGTTDAGRHGIAMIHQELSLVPSLSVADNLFLGREGRSPWLDRRGERVRAAATLRRVGVDVPLEAHVGDLPLAARQMIEIAKALVCEARILIMDEPTSALGEREAARLFEVVRDLRDSGRTIVFISHRMKEVYDLADRITVLRDGRRVGTEAASQLPPGRLVQWMVGRSLGAQFPPRTGNPGTELLRAENVWVKDPSGRARWAVQDVSFALRRGEILGLAGLHGSGNSELLAALCGCHGPLPRGSLSLDGRRVAVRNPRQAVRLGLAFVSNDRKRDGLVLSMSVLQNITRAAFRRFSPGGWIRERRERDAAARQCRELGIAAASPLQAVNELSGGNQQKVVLANWLETAPTVLLLDEPTRGVDVGAKQDIYTLMNRWTEAGMGILLITSEMPELLALADRILVLHRGRALRTFARHEASQEAIVHAAMGECALEDDGNSAHE
ncbi:MAG: sugar ABC transporter ATP-binding protein [Lentisphaeria bacterium]|nr:sugar ABC transporter ATP-binding protein [Lentisphaeria bacterium]